MRELWGTHSLLLDGIYVGDGMTQAPLFVETPTPTDGEIRKLVETIAGRVNRLLARRGMLGDDVGAPDQLAEDEPPKGFNLTRYHGCLGALRRYWRARCITKGARRVREQGSWRPPRVTAVWRHDPMLTACERSSSLPRRQQRSPPSTSGDSRSRPRPRPTSAREHAPMKMCLSA